MTSALTAPALLAQARALGAELFVEDGRVRIRGPGRIPPELRGALRERTDQLRALLQGRSEPYHDSRPATPEQHSRVSACIGAASVKLALLPAGADPENPPSGWSFFRHGPLSGLWIGPNGELDSGGDGAARVEPRPRTGFVTEPPRRCYACRRDDGEWWRLRTATAPWICVTCHPPGPPADAIERQGRQRDA